MALEELKLGGQVYNRVDVAIQRLQLFEPIALQYSDKGYYVADSGGKDSTVIKKIAELSGVKYEVVHNHTTADHPETVYFVRREQQRYGDMGIDYTIDYPDTTMRRLIIKNGVPPLQQIRYCCVALKERSGIDRVVVTGVRWSESRKRRSRGIAEIQAPKQSDKITLMNDNDENAKNLKLVCAKENALSIPLLIGMIAMCGSLFIDITCHIIRYTIADGNVLGCVGCPMGNNYRELESNPAYKKIYIKTFDKMLENRKQKGLTNKINLKSGEEVYLWWTKQVRYSKDENQVIFEMDEEEELQ